MNRSSARSYRVWATSSYWKNSKFASMTLRPWVFFQQKMMILYVEVVPASSWHIRPLIEPEVFRPFFKINLCNLHPLWRTSGRVATAWPPWWLWVPGPQQKGGWGVGRSRQFLRLVGGFANIWTWLDCNYQTQWSFSMFWLEKYYYNSNKRITKLNELFVEFTASDTVKGHHSGRWLFLEVLLQAPAKSQTFMNLQVPDMLLERFLERFSNPRY